MSSTASATRADVPFRQPKAKTAREPPVALCAALPQVRNHRIGIAFTAGRR